MKERQRRKKKKERDKNKEPKESKKERQEGRKKEKKTSERQRKRNRKRGRPKKAKGERKRNTENKQKNALFWGKSKVVFCIKEPKKTKNKTTKTNKEGLGSGEEPNKKQQKYQKIAFQLPVKFFFFWVGVQISFFLTTWPKKRSPPKHYKNRGFRPFFWKADMRHKTAIFGPKNQNHKIQLSFFLPIFFSFDNQKPKFAETPIFILF